MESYNTCLLLLLLLSSTSLVGPCNYRKEKEYRCLPPSFKTSKRGQRVPILLIIKRFRHGAKLELRYLCNLASGHDDIVEMDMQMVR